MLKKKIWANFRRIIELFTKKIVKKLFKIWSWDPGSGSRDPGSGKKNHSGSRIQGSKRHRIPDPGSGSATLVYMLKRTLVAVYMLKRTLVAVYMLKRTLVALSAILMRTAVSIKLQRCRLFCLRYWRELPVAVSLTLRRTVGSCLHKT